MGLNIPDIPGKKNICITEALVQYEAYDILAVI